MAKAHKTKSGRWEIRVGAGSAGKSKTFTADSKREVEAMAALWLQKSHTPDEQLRLGDAMDKYIAQRENILSPSTISGYKIIRRNSLGTLENKRLCDVTPSMMQTFINELSSKNAPKTVKNVYGLICSVFRAFDRDADFSRIALPAKQARIVNFPTVPQLLAAFDGSDIELPVLMGLVLGMRASEIRGARRSDIHDGILTISGTVLTVDGKDVRREQTKTYGSTRRIRLPKKILELIEALPPDQEQLVMMPEKSIYYRFKKTLAANDLPQIRFHDLRHLNASVMLSLGIPEKYAMERGGWSSPSIMRGVYQHTFDEDRRKVDDLMEDFFFS